MGFGLGVGGCAGTGMAGANGLATVSSRLKRSIFC